MPATSKRKRAHARTMAPTIASSAATFRNILARTMAPAVLASGATFRNNAGPYHAGARFGGRLHILKCLHLRPNSRQHLAPRNCAHIVAHGRAHIAAHGSACKPRRTSRQHLRPTPVGNNNPGARLFTFKAANPRMIRGFNGAQFFTSEKLISGSRVVRLYYYAAMRICAYEHRSICGYAHRSIPPLCVEPHGKIDQGLDTHLAGS